MNTDIILDIPSQIALSYPSVRVMAFFYALIGLYIGTMYVYLLDEMASERYKMENSRDFTIIAKFCKVVGNVYLWPAFVAIFIQNHLEEEIK